MKKASSVLSEAAFIQCCGDWNYSASLNRLQDSRFKLNLNVTDIQLKQKVVT